MEAGKRKGQWQKAGTVEEKPVTGRCLAQSIIGGHFDRRSLAPATDEAVLQARQRKGPGGWG